MSAETTKETKVIGVSIRECYGWGVTGEALTLQCTMGDSGHVCKTTKGIDTIKKSFGLSIPAGPQYQTSRLQCKC